MMGSRSLPLPVPAVTDLCPWVSPDPPHPHAAPQPVCQRRATSSHVEGLSHRRFLRTNKPFIFTLRTVEPARRFKACISMLCRS